TLPESLESAGKGAFETRGRLSLQAPDSFRVRSQMLDNNWNLNWNFGANGRYNGKNEENYQLVLSRLMNVDLNEWKPEARCILAVNYLESGCPETEQYDEYIRDHQYECMEMIIARQRWHALNCGLDREVIDENILPDYLSRITDRTEKAILLGRQRKRTDSFDDLMNLF
ncbi:MAG: hypothetical protein K6A40_08075, partial [Solobacterium sp.]|nr:hypothetical protein [Solobacterium sp.]